MKDILIKYPIKILQQELVNIRTNYRLEKKKIMEILRTMKSIKKLTKEQLVDLLIENKVDISKLPKLEDLEKPKISTGKNQSLTRKQLKEMKLKSEIEKEKLIIPDYDEAIKIIDSYEEYDKKEKEKFFKFINYVYKYVNNLENMKNKLIEKMILLNAYYENKIKGNRTLENIYFGVIKEDKIKKNVDSFFNELFSFLIKKILLENNFRKEFIKLKYKNVEEFIKFAIMRTHLYKYFKLYQSAIDEIVINIIKPIKKD